MSSSGVIALIGGSGRLPVQVADSLTASGRTHRILAFRGFASPELRRRADAVVDLLDLKTIMVILESWKPEAVSLVGAVRRPGYSALLGAYTLLRNMQEVKEVISRGDDSVLRGAVTLLEEHGHRVIGVQDLAPELVAPPSLRGRHAPQPDDAEAVGIGLDLLSALSPFDIGQAAVVAKQHVLAIEGPEGTDRMLRRVANSRSSLFGLRRRREGGVLIKAAKRGQDLRVDMPAIGPRTVTEAARAGLSGIAIGSGSTLIVDQDRTVETADRLGLFIETVALPWVSS
jgi:DUF1009 family protein